MASVLVYTNGGQDRVVKRDNLVFVAHGPTGPPGADGNIENELELPAGGDLSGNRAVYLKDGFLYYADKDTEESVLSIVGVTKHAAISGTNVKVLLYGVMLEPSWMWTYPAPVFLGSNGQLSQSRPDTGFFVNMGSAVSQKELFVKVGRVIKLK